MSTVPCSPLQIITAHEVLSCGVPAGVGYNLSVDITVNDQSVASLFSYLGIVNSLLVYIANIFLLAPIIINTTAAPTQGGRTIVTGDYLGSNSSFIQVTIDGKDCTSVRMVVPQTSISCVVNPGTGKDLTLITTVGGQSVSVDNFAYQGILKFCYYFFFCLSNCHSIAPVFGEISSPSSQGGAVIILGTLFFQK